MLRGVTSIMYKESIHIVRDPLTLFLMLLVPGLQITIFGYAIDLDVKNVATVVYNLDGRPASRELVDAFKHSSYFDVRKVVTSDDEMVREVIADRAKVGLKIPPDYSDDLLMGRPAQVQVLIDGSDATVAMQALNVANAIALRESFVRSAEAAQRPAVPLIEMRARVLFNPDMRTSRFTVPGLVAIVMQLVTMFLTAFAIVREKENGTLEQLMVTPVSRLGLMIGKLVPYGVIGAIETCIVLLIMRFLFQVEIAGNLLLLAGFAFVFLFTGLGFGLFISTVAANQVQAIQLSFLMMLPAVLLSGFVFPLESMPAPIYAIGQIIPATYFIRILRGIILRDAGFAILWPDGAYLLGFGIMLLTVSTRRFRKTID
ncbi:MAG: ABC transporter permease [Candidatus Hydrogenedentota bacterium]